MGRSPVRLPYVEPAPRLVSFITQASPVLTRDPTAGRRNHQAKKFLRDEMKLGHECLFYASNWFALISLSFAFPDPSLPFA